jgi:hypothetical protein
MSNTSLTRTLLPVALAAGFALAHTLAPLFYSNQNQYLLHGLADAGYGHLDRDWLANTKDPTLLFSLGVNAAYRVAGLWPLQAAYFLLLMGYFLAMWWLVSAVAPVARYPLPFAALFTAAHAAIPRWLSVQLTGVDYPWFLQAGLAGQYALGPGLQPSAFAVLLIAGLAAWANGRPYLAAVLGASACLVHPTYLLAAGLITLGYVHALAREGRPRVAGSLSVVSLVIVLPVIVYALATFTGTTPKVSGLADDILVTVRIPHHAVVSRWFDLVAGLQVAWIALGIALLRRTRLFVPLAVAAGLSAVLTLLQVIVEAVGGDTTTLALLFPWRLSVVLVPVATAAITARLVTLLPDRRWVGWASGAVFVALAVGGVVVMVSGLGYRMNEDELPVLHWVRDHAQPDDVYLIPARIPGVGSGRGSMSASFTPPPRPDPGSNLIPVDLQRFRLATGAPIFVDFKSIPYADAEVLEWHRRLLKVEMWYATADWDAAGVREQLRAEGITHVLIPRHQAIRATFLEPVYTDDAYGVYRVP